MKVFNQKLIVSIIASFVFVHSNIHALAMPAHERDILFEGKGAVFVSADSTFKGLYNNCPDFGLEVTGRLFDRLYAFSSVDFIRKDGATVALGSTTQLSIVNLALGAKYFLPFTHGDFYFGIGISPTFLCTNDQVPQKIHQTQWSCGGIAKLGLILDLPHSMFLDFFADYSFVKSPTYSPSPVQLQITHLDGAVLGIGFGYRFH